MEYHAPHSTCLLCGSKFSNRGMSRHIRSCLKKELQNRLVEQAENLMHLHISAPYNPDYFLHILVLEQAKLRDLDRYLKDIWLECCGHMSAFFGQSYRDEVNMNVSFDDVFTQTSQLKYQYDFGDTTELVIKMLDIYPGTSDLENRINLLCRNSQPMVPCDNCGKQPAKEICTECQWDGDGWLCEKCVQDHECDDEMLLPVTNSPRVGVCTYSGSDVDEDNEPKVFVDRIVSRKIESPSQVASISKRGGKPTKKKSSEELNLKIERVTIIKDQIRFFCKRYLDKELEGYAFKLVDTMSRKRKINIARGKIEIWAAAIIYVIARLNFLFDQGHEYYVSAATICDFFKTKKSTVSNKATQIEDACDLTIGAEGYCSPDISDVLTLFKSPQGFLIPKNLMPEIGSLFSDNMPLGMEADLLLKLFKEVETSIPKNIRQDVKIAFEQLVNEVLEEMEDTTDEPPNNAGR